MSRRMQATYLADTLDMYPGLPVVCEVDSDVCCCDGDYAWYLAEDVAVRHDWLLARNDETIEIVGDLQVIFRMSGDAEDCVRNYLEDDERTVGMTKEQFDALVAEELAKLEPYWIECVVLVVAP